MTETPTTAQTAQGGTQAATDEIRLALELARTAMYRARCLLNDAQRYSVRTHPEAMHDHLREAGDILWDGWNVADAALRIDAPQSLAEAGL